MGVPQWNVPLSKQDLTLRDLVSALNAYGVASGAVGGGDGAVAPSSSGVGNAYAPGDHGLLTWAFDPSSMLGNTTPIAGQLALARLHVKTSTLVTNIVLLVLAGSGFTAGQNFAGIWAASGGALLGLTGDQSGVWTSGGVKIMPLTAAITLPVGDVYVGFWANASSLPGVGRGSLLVDAGNAGLAGSPTPRFAQGNSGLTTTAPNPVTIAGPTVFAWWVALS